MKDDAAVPEEFAWCTLHCWAGGPRHTYALGLCAKADEQPYPDPNFGWRESFDADGQAGVVLHKIPLRAVLPWTRYLPLDERFAMMEDLARSEEPDKTLKAWRATAMTWADPMAIAVLTRDHDHQDYVDAPRPQDGELTTGQIAKILGVSRPTVVRLLDAGKIASTQINVARKAKLSDVLKYRDSRTTAVDHEDEGK